MLWISIASWRNCFLSLQLHCAIPTRGLGHCPKLHQENFEGAFGRRDDGVQWVHKVMHRKAPAQPD